MLPSVVHLKVNSQTASKRTRKCLNNAGPMFELIKTGQPDSIRHNSILVRSCSTGWFGWLPLHEVLVHPKTPAVSV